MHLQKLRRPVTLLTLCLLPFTFTASAFAQGTEDGTPVTNPVTADPVAEPIIFAPPAGPVTVPADQEITAVYVYKQLIAPEGVTLGKVDSLPDSLDNTISKDGVYRGYLYLDSQTLPKANQYGVFPVVVTVVDEIAGTKIGRTVVLVKNKPAQPADLTTTGDWKDEADNAKQCDIKKVKQTRTITTTTYTWSDEKNAWVENTSSKTENRLREMTATEIKDCTVNPAEETAPKDETAKDASAPEVPVLAKAEERTADAPQLASTGAATSNILTAFGLTLFAGLASVFGIRKAEVVR